MCQWLNVSALQDMLVIFCLGWPTYVNIYTDLQLQETVIILLSDMSDLDSGILFF